MIAQGGKAKQIFVAVHESHDNLKRIDLKLPRQRLIVVTGVSGSGKSSLVFDTLYHEGRRRMLEAFGRPVAKQKGSRDPAGIR